MPFGRVGVDLAARIPVVIRGGLAGVHGAQFPERFSGVLRDGVDGNAEVGADGFSRFAKAQAVEDLYQTLATEIPSAQDREKFLRSRPL